MFVLRKLDEVQFLFIYVIQLKIYSLFSFLYFQQLLPTSL